MQVHRAGKPLVPPENRTKERFVADGGEVVWSKTPDDFTAMLRGDRQVGEGGKGGEHQTGII